jgi:hypothetical protein
MEADLSERLDKLLAFMESVDGVCGNGTMLILGNSVLHSRFQLSETRLVIKWLLHDGRCLIITRLVLLDRVRAGIHLFIAMDHGKIFTL